MRSRIKHLAEGALLRSGIAALSRRRRRDDVLVLAYHDVVPTGQRVTGEASLHLAEADFVRQLDALRRSHEVVPLESILDVDAPAGRRARVAITFDDAYAGALDAGIPNLVRRGMPATIFVAPGLLGRTTWWDDLAGEAGTLPTADRNRALHELRGDGEAVLRWAETSLPAGVASTGGSARIATLAAVQAAARQPGITMGSHSWSHANLAALDRDTLEREMRAPMAWLREHLEGAIPWLAYPYGLYSATVAAAAAEAGYVGALRVDGGWAGRGRPAPALAIPRYNVPAGISLDGFRLRLAGIGAG